jgi:hypothetical protein
MTPADPAEPPRYRVRSRTRYATKRASGKNKRLKRKKRMKLWPFLLATRAGQKAIAIQMAIRMIVQSQKLLEARIMRTPPRRWCSTDEEATPS